MTRLKTLLVAGAVVAIFAQTALAAPMQSPHPQIHQDRGSADRSDTRHSPPTDGWRVSNEWRRVQQSDQPTASEFLADFRELGSANALSAYATMETARSRAVVAVQTGEFTDAKRDRLAALLTVLESFVTAYEAAQAGNTTESLRLIGETSDSVESLRTSGGAEYGALAQLAVDRFYLTRGDELRTEARNTTATAARIELLEAAVAAYRAGGGDARLSSTASNLERTRVPFQADMAAVNESVKTTRAFLRACDGQCAGAQTALSAHRLGVFDRYLTAREADSEARRAVTLANKHELEQRAATLAERAGKTQSGLLGLALASVSVFVGYTVLAVLVCTLVAVRVTQWGADTDAATVGQIIPRDSPSVSDE